MNELIGKQAKSSICSNHDKRASPFTSPPVLYTLPPLVATSSFSETVFLTYTSLPLFFLIFPQLTPVGKWAFLG